MTDDPRRGVPRTDAVLADPRLVAATERLGRTTVKAAVAQAQQAVRRGQAPPERVADLAAAALPTTATSLRPVLNATGVVLHTNLGRAPLSPAAIHALTEAAGYADVEFDLVTGNRARRGRGALEALRTALPEAGDVHVVGNGAAALTLAATALAAGGEIVVSRGELVEIGDGFRLPDLLTSTGARIREVGTTNRTSLDDYAAALSPDTGFVLKVHPSNFRIQGFTSAVPVADLVTLGVPVVVDTGSGLLRPDPTLPGEPDLASALADGAGLVTASGDKLLGGPQAGLIAGHTDLVERLRRHPLARALRVDKLTLAALEATLIGPPTPTEEARRAGPDLLRHRVEDLVADLRARGVDAATHPSDGVVGGGGAPGLRLPGWAISLPREYAATLRRGEPAVVGRVERDRCLLDLRCIAADDEALLREAVLAAGTAAAGTAVTGPAVPERC